VPIHTDEHIQERRDRLAHLLAKGVSPREAAGALGLTMQVVRRDIKWMNEDNDRGLNDLARGSIQTLYNHNVMGMQDLIKECWNMYLRSNYKPKKDTRGIIMKDESGRVIEEMVEPIDRISQRTRVEALRTAGMLMDILNKMVQDGPALFELKSMKKKLEDLKNGLEISV
jgi:hypothetical protein